MEASPCYSLCAIDPSSNKRQSNLVKGGIAVHPTPYLYSAGGSTQQQFGDCMFSLGV